MTEVSRDPAPQFRPRPGPLRLMFIAQGALLLGFVTPLALLLLRDPVSTSSMQMMDRMMALIPWSFVPLGVFMSAYLHAYWGAFGQLGLAPTPLQLWRHPELRRLPALRPLKPALFAALYLVPLTVAVTSAWWMTASTQRQRAAADELYEVESQWTDAAHLGFIRVGCMDFPVETVRQNSRCFIAVRAFQGVDDAESAVREWVRRQRETVVLSDPPRMHEAPAIALPFLRGGGVVGGHWTVPLYRQGSALRPFTLDFLSRKVPVKGAVPQALNVQARWLTRQPFHTYLIVTPAGEPSSPGVTAP